MKNKRIKNLYQELRKKHGRPQGQWKLWCKRPQTLKEKEEVVIGAILTQNTSWRNVEKAMADLKNAGFCGLRDIDRLSEQKEKLGSLIRSSGFYRQKTNYLCDLAQFILRRHKNLKQMAKAPLERLREELLSLKGVGPETADSILLYALEKPIFVIDEYTRRLLEKKGITKEKNYAILQDLFQKNLKKDYRLYQDFHALIVINAKTKQSC
ncbi:MAG: endonuclease [bacterium]|nr:endonuclease [bacterium]